MKVSVLVCLVTLNIGLSFRLSIKSSILCNSRLYLGKKDSFTNYSKRLSVGILSSLLLTNIILPIPTTFIAPVHADFRAQQKRTFFRFAPKLETGRDFYKNDLKKAIDSEDWKAIENIFEEYVTKYNPNDPKQIDAVDTFVNANYIRPMTVLGGSFAEKAVSPKQQALEEQRLLFEKALKKLEGSVKPIKGEGFFAADIKPPTGPAKKKQALEAYNEGKDALNKYIQIVNSGLMQELNPLKTF